jgi:hypothetical protein
MQAGSQSSDIKSPPPVIGGFVISRIAMALASQASFHFGHQKRVLKRSFEDPAAFIECWVSCLLSTGIFSACIQWIGLILGFVS